MVQFQGIEYQPAFQKALTRQTVGSFFGNFGKNHSFCF